MTTTAPQTVSLDVALKQAVAHHQAGRLQEAEQLYRAILQAQPYQPDANHNLGVLAGQVGQHAAGLSYLKTALAINPSHGQYALSYADALLATGQAGEALNILQTARQRGFNTPAAQALQQKAEAAVSNGTVKGVAPSPAEINQFVALFNAGHHVELENRARLLLERYPYSGFAWKVLGISLQMQGKDALPALRKAIELLPNDAGAHNNLGSSLRELGQLAGAVESCRRALEISPDFAEAHNNLGVSLQDLGQLDNAVASYRRALEIKPDYAEARNNLGNGLKDLGQFDGAVASYRRALEIKPNYAEAHSNLGTALQDLGQLDGAMASYAKALEIKPDFALAHNNLGGALKELGHPDAAMASYRRALEVKPDDAEAHLGLALGLLTMGRYSEGWSEYEYRWEGAIPKPLRPVTSLPQWAGHPPLSGDCLLLLEEQGQGDRLQFIRYLPLAAERFAGGVSLVSGSPLLALFRRSFPGVEILEDIPADQGAWQWQCPLLSLPLAFGTTLETIPQQVPYLVPDPVRAAFWQTRIAELGLPATTRKIGIVWKKGSLMKNASSYSLPLQQLSPLLNLPGCAWFSLQKEPDPDKAPWVASGKLIDWAEEFGDFDETAALAVNLDLIVSVDTAMTHLAGGLGLPTWLFNRHASDWRWMRDRDDSPWYPTMRIFNQKKAGEWDEVVERMAATLASGH